MQAQALLDGLEMFKQALGDKSPGLCGYMYLIASQCDIQFLDDGLDSFFVLNFNSTQSHLCGEPVDKTKQLYLNKSL